MRWWIRDKTIPQGAWHYCHSSQTFKVNALNTLDEVDFQLQLVPCLQQTGFIFTFYVVYKTNSRRRLLDDLKKTIRLYNTLLHTNDISQSFQLQTSDLGSYTVKNTQIMRSCVHTPMQPALKMIKSPAVKICLWPWNGLKSLNMRSAHLMTKQP